MGTTVKIQGKDYSFGALKIAVLVTNWGVLLLLVKALFSIGRLVAQTAIGAIGDGSTFTVDRRKLLQVFAESSFPEQVEKALSSLAPEQVAAIIDLMFVSFSKNCPTISREQFDELLTLDVLPECLLAFIRAQGITLGEKTDPGEAKPEATPADPSTNSTGTPG